jgi:hypothetical protein
MCAGTTKGDSVSKTLHRLLRGCSPIMLVTALVAVLGISGTAYGAKLITGFDIKDGSVTAADLSKTTQAALHGGKGDKGARGLKGSVGAIGTRGTHGTAGAFGQTGAQGATGPQGASGPQGATGAQGVTGNAGAASTVVGPQGPIGNTGPVSTVPGPQGPVGPGGTTNGAVCTLSPGHTGTIHFVDVGSGTDFSITCVGVNP